MYLIDKVINIFIDKHAPQSLQRLIIRILLVLLFLLENSLLQKLRDLK